MQIYVSNQGKQEGPFNSFDELTGKVHHHSLVWYQGLNEWKKSTDLPQISHLLPQGLPPNLHSLSGIQYADFGNRFGGHLIDTLLLTAFNYVAGIAAYIGGYFIIIEVLSFSYINSGVTLTLLSAAIIQMVVLVVFCTYYFIIPISRKGYSFGKKTAKVKVLSLSTMQPPTFWQTVGREFAKAFISIFTLGINYLFPLWTEKKQTLHDIAANTIVIRNK